MRGDSGLQVRAGRRSFFLVLWVGDWMNVGGFCGVRVL